VNQNRNRGCGCTGVLALLAILVMLETPGWQVPMLIVLVASALIGVLYWYTQIQQKRQQSRVLAAPQLPTIQPEVPRVATPQPPDTQAGPASIWTGGKAVGGFCTHCGTPFQADAHYCRKCGRPIT
jgi:zinc-ribbon domain